MPGGDGRHGNKNHVISKGLPAHLCHGRLPGLMVYARSQLDLLTLAMLEFGYRADLLVERLGRWKAGRCNYAGVHPKVSMLKSCIEPLGEFPAARGPLCPRGHLAITGY